MPLPASPAWTVKSVGAKLLIVEVKVVGVMTESRTWASFGLTMWRTGAVRGVRTRPVAGTRPGSRTATVPLPPLASVT